MIGNQAIKGICCIMSCEKENKEIGNVDTGTNN